MEKPAPENIFILAHVKPTKDDADANGNVLYFSPTLGWYQGSWVRTYMVDVTHWTYLPELPPSLEDPLTRMNRTFNEWVDDKYPNVEVPAKALLRIGYEAGYKKTS